MFTYSLVHLITLKIWQVSNALMLEIPKSLSLLNPKYRIYLEVPLRSSLESLRKFEGFTTSTCMFCFKLSKLEFGLLTFELLNLQVCVLYIFKVFAKVLC